MHTLNALVRLRLMLLFAGMSIMGITRAQTYPAGFSQVLVASGLTSPTSMAAAPDGRMFITLQGGSVRVLKNGNLLTRPFMTVPVQLTGERGLLGIAFHPGFATNKYIYLYFTVPSGAYNRISRFTASGDTVLPSSERIILTLDSLSSATHHNGGTMQFGKDGKLYVGVGENGLPSNAQNLDNFMGKILRINDDGTIPAGNPFTSGTLKRQRIWAYGMRNPFTLSMNPLTGQVYVNDVGEKAWEEVNDCTLGGGNYGWPTAEGVSTNTSFRNPAYAYGHGTTEGLGCAITGGTFFAPATTTYPSTYKDSYFYLDYCGRWMGRLSFANGTVTRSPFATALPDRPVTLITGMDGNLYFLSRANAALYKVVYSTSAKPLITSQPASKTVSVGNPVSFSVTATGGQPMSFQWLKNGNAINLATTSTYSIAQVAVGDSGLYTVRVSNASGSVTSTGARLTVTPRNANPVATILSPTDPSTYGGGHVISFSGSATDAEDGAIPARRFQWFAEFFHDAHSHPGMYVPDSVSSGSFTIPQIGETSPNVYYRLYLVVTDNSGARDTAYRDIRPGLSRLTFNSNPQPLQLMVDGQPFTTPFSVVGVEGMKRTIAAPASQIIYNALKYRFSAWSQGGASSQTITTPVADITYTARYSVVYRSPDNPTSTSSGLNYNYYEGSWSALPAFGSLTPVSKGTVTGPSLTPRKRDDNFGFQYTGFIQVPTNGIYTFYTNSDEGSRLRIDTAVVVKNDGLHLAQQASGKIALLAGKHRIVMEYFERTGSQSLIVSYGGPGIAKQLVPTTAWSRQPLAAARSLPEATESQDNNADILLSPNPADQQIIIKLPKDAGIAQLNIADMQGRLVRRYRLFASPGIISTSELAGGHYLFTVETANGTWSKLVIIRH